MNVDRGHTMKIDGHTISNSYCEKLLGVKIDSQLNFNNYLETIFKKASQKVHVLARITLYIYMFWLELRLLSVFQKESC